MTKTTGPETRGPEDHETRGPRDQRTAGPEDQETRGPRDQRTRDHGTTDHGTKDQETTGPRAWPNLPKPNLGRTFQKKTDPEVGDNIKKITIYQSEPCSMVFGHCGSV